MRDEAKAREPATTGLPVLRAALEEGKGRGGKARAAWSRLVCVQYVCVRAFWFVNTPYYIGGRLNYGSRRNQVWIGSVMVGNVLLL